MMRVCLALTVTATAPTCTPKLSISANSRPVCVRKPWLVPPPKPLPRKVRTP